MISSVSNKIIKDAVKLRDSSARKDRKLFIFEGKREIALALDRGVFIQELFVCFECLSKDCKALIASAKAKRITIHEVSLKVYEKLSYGNKRDGIIAIARVPQYSLSDISLGKNPLLVVIDNIEKPGNIGAILRTADACGVDGVIVTGSASDIYNHHVARSSIGTLFVKPVVCALAKEVLAWLKRNSIILVSADPEGKITYTAVDFKKPTAIILGSEQKGLSSFWKEHADQTSFIPMKGKADSLNVSITAAVFIFEALRQRYKI